MLFKKPGYNLKKDMQRLNILDIYELNILQNMQSLWIYLQDVQFSNHIVFRLKTAEQGKRTRNDDKLLLKEVPFKNDVGKFTFTCRAPWIWNKIITKKPDVIDKNIYRIETLKYKVKKMLQAELNDEFVRELYYLS